MNFIKQFPSLRKFGKHEREVIRGNRVISEGLWSESVIKSCCIDKKIIKKAINIAIKKERKANNDRYPEQQRMNPYQTIILLEKELFGDKK